MSLDPAPDAIAVSLTCPRCGSVGSAVWEKQKWGPALATLSGNFYERLAKFSPYKIEIVCEGCGRPAAEWSEAASRFVAGRALGRARSP